MKNYITLFIIACIISSFGPPNCNLYEDDEACYKACNEAEKAIMHPQGSKASQVHFDKSIALCPTFSYSYYEKGVPFVKRGLNNKWIELINKAVEHNPKEYLGHRGWCHYLFMKNYQPAIDDIEALDAMLDYDIGPTGNGEYHLHVVRALCYKGLGNQEKSHSYFNEAVF